ncbi:hypothetical protein [Oceanobacillus senegalensis]|uniref:hypothetical protein n=1 Tax=Oceanobacillus senegalensis TaxID=1936063 RepID=UPI000A313EAC|nr:hypothetical protein [Oceanobacillus senegalensis]
MPKEHNKKFSNFSNVERMKNELIPEEFPEGAFGSAINKEERVRSKSTPWEKGQKRMSNFVFPDEEQHDNLPRQIPGAHPLHDE